MKIVVLDGAIENPGDLSWSGFEALGELTVYDATPDDDGQILSRIGDAEAVLTNKTPLRAAVIEKAPNLAYIGVLATGYNVVDVGAAKARGVPVTNTPGYGADAVAQFAIAMLLEICCRVGQHDAAVHAGRWAPDGPWCFWDYPLMELAGKTMGIIGYGTIGRTTGRIARALGMEVLFNSGHPQPELESDSCRYAELDELFARADVISLHCPLFPSTRGIISREAIGKMKDGVIILNNARGPLIDEEALAEALNAGKVYAAGLDVMAQEPIRPDNPLLHAKNCFITPHISWASRESRQRLMDIAVENLRAFQAGSPIHVVNL